jgi:hypothetical protein
MSDLAGPGSYRVARQRLELLQYPPEGDEELGGSLVEGVSLGWLVCHSLDSLFGEVVRLSDICRKHFHDRPVISFRVVCDSFERVDRA